MCSSSRNGVCFGAGVSNYSSTQPFQRLVPSCYTGATVSTATFAHRRQERDGQIFCMPDMVKLPEVIRSSFFWVDFWINSRHQQMGISYSSFASNVHFTFTRLFSLDSLSMHPTADPVYPCIPKLLRIYRQIYWDTGYCTSGKSTSDFLGCEIFKHSRIVLFQLGVVSAQLL